MGRGINKVILVGNLGADPELRHTSGGTPVATFRLATSETWKDRQTGEMQERTEWHSVVAWSRLGEIVGEYLGKGSKVYVEGKLQTRKWQDQSGQDRYTTEVVAGEIQMLDARDSGQPQSPSQQRGSQKGQKRRQPPRQQNNPIPAAPAGGDFDDDIPF